MPEADTSQKTVTTAPRTEAGVVVDGSPTLSEAGRDCSIQSGSVGRIA